MKSSHRQLTVCNTANNSHPLNTARTTSCLPSRNFPAAAPARAERVRGKLPPDASEALHAPWRRCRRSRTRGVLPSLFQLHVVRGRCHGGEANGWASPRYKDRQFPFSPIVEEPIMRTVLGVLVVVG